MTPVFSDPTPRVERKDSLCTVVSVGSESTTHTGKAGVVSFRGKNYAATIIGSVAAGDQAHFIQTAEGHVWAIQKGTYYRSAYPKRPNEWAKKSPASLAILELMKKNRRHKVFQSGPVRSVGASSATVALDGKNTSFPTKFEGQSKTSSAISPGKICLVFEKEIVWTGGQRIVFTIKSSISERYSGHSGLIVYGPPSSGAAYMAAVYSYAAALKAPFPQDEIVQRMLSAGYSGLSILSHTETNNSVTGISYNQQGSPPPLESEYTSFSHSTWYSVEAEYESPGTMPSTEYSKTMNYGPF